MKTHQIDFSGAFAQGKLPPDKKVHVSLPRGFGTGEDSALKLCKGLCGMVKSPMRWFTTVKSAFVKLGCQQSKCDQCLFVNDKEKTIVSLHTDDCLCFACDDESLSKLVKGL